MKDIEIYKVPAGRKYWVVRSKAGFLFDTFISRGIVAVGHLDDELEGRFKEYSGQEWDYESHKDAIDGLVKTTFKNKNSKKREQLEKFLSELNMSDWVITIKGTKLQVGVITSGAYFASDELLPPNPENPAAFNSASYIRRKVSWGPSLDMSDLSYGFAQTLRASRTVFSIDKYLTDLHHLLFPMFVYQNDVYISVKVGLPSNIPIRPMSELFTAASLLQQDSGAVIDDASVKAFFFSKGSVWIKLTVAAGFVTAGAAAVTGTFHALDAGYTFISNVVNGNEVTGVRPWSETYETLSKGNDSPRVELRLSTPDLNTETLRHFDEGDTLISREHIAEGLDVE